MGGFNMKVSVEVLRFDPISGRLASNIIQTFTDKETFNNFYNDWKKRDGRNQIIVRNYDISENTSLNDIYDKILIGPENITYLKMEKKTV
jgi:hypothetical protein